MLILSATNGKNLDLAQAFAAEAASSGAAAEVISLPELQLPLYDSLADNGAGDGLLKLAEALRHHKSLIICAPEYNGSIPPVLSNAIAWLSVSTDDFRALFNGRPVALATHSGGSGQKVMLAIRQQLSHLGCTVLGREVQSNSQKAANPEAIAALVSQLVALESAYEGVPAQA
ncbi:MULTISPECIES: NAD(P)H-dependent oxidoreductase [Cyanophyceae]|uniref:NADPH-dependent FMN reductase n=1 Tax=Cyanophyceae TaxID=3028117 RepID=UPI0016893621|nr:MULTISPECIES: NAD(P)H-dependent oxidoreductase [Cyanophyceae]MBD1914730.1 NAD(P)H-dependent oxidoreductase [Phormidium sp. FACHB-77]MBD2030833.1 NAD(P)H-dependent oxidoreductase [Phormidium sp. FACHB-322]MBD2052432.1 NAD(P)H-dependent oxidoreductase [Leptolyngbya sp. FACHB-60]